jgi:hypothetical protein
MKIGVTGCSNSSYGWGNPWHYYMGEALNAKIIPSSSPGAGNEMNIEKVRYILENDKPDYFVCQLTQSVRMVLGIWDWVPGPGESDYYYPNKDNYQHLNHGQVFLNQGYYTFNAHTNNENLERMFDKKFKVDDFLLNHAVPSNYNLYFKIFQTMMTIQHLCNIHNCKLLFFTWFDDLEQLALKSNYTETLKTFNYIPWNVAEYAKSNEIYNIPGDGHFKSEEQKRIYDGFIHPHVVEMIKNHTSPHA